MTLMENEATIIIYSTCGKKNEVSNLAGWEQTLWIVAERKMGYIRERIEVHTIKAVETS